MIHLHLPDTAWHDARANLLFFENGRAVGARRVFSPDSLLGITVLLPRSLGARALSLSLYAERGERLLSASLSFAECVGNTDAYAVILDTIPDAALPLAFCAVEVDSAYGRLYLERRGSSIGFSAFPSEHTRLPLLFLAKGDALPALCGGSLYCLPYIRAARMDEGEIASFFSSLSSLGVRGLYLSPLPGEGACGSGDDPSASLPHAFVAAAQQADVCLLGDFLLLCGVSEHPDLLFGGFCSPPSGDAPVEEEPRPAFWSTPLPNRHEKPLSFAECCGEEGVVAAALRAGYDGLVVRAADCFGDAFLSSVRAALCGAARPVLLGGTQSGGVTIAFGTRRRFFFGGELDAPLSYVLRTALLAYFLNGDTEPLADYFENTIPLLPPHALACMPNLLSDGAVGLFWDALSPLGEDREAYAAMGYLAAATLPGIPAYFAGEEESAWEGGSAFLRRTALLRKRECAYNGGSLRLLHLSKTLLVFLRECEGETLLTVLNPSDEPLTITSPDGFSVVFGGRGRKESFTVRPRGGAVLKLALWEGEPCHLRFSHT